MDEGEPKEKKNLTSGKSKDKQSRRQTDRHFALETQPACHFPFPYASFVAIKAKEALVSGSRLHWC